MESEVRVPAQPPPPLPGDGEKGRAEAPLPLELGDISGRTVLATGSSCPRLDRRWEGDASAPGHLDVTSAFAHDENFSANRCRLENGLRGTRAGYTWSVSNLRASHARRGSRPAPDLDVAGDMQKC